MKKTSKQTVMEEARVAYCDSTLPWNEAVNKRKLDWRASMALSPKDAAEVMKKAVPGGYNNFRADLLSLFPDDCKIILAREGSVCIYVVKGEKPLPKKADKLLEDENSTEADGTVRIWWD